LQATLKELQREHKESVTECGVLRAELVKEGETRAQLEKKVDDLDKLKRRNSEKIEEMEEAQNEAKKTRIASDENLLKRLDAVEKGLSPYQ
jgi:septal ring factor EnvC (AmiA/AmiB activator)